MAVRGAARDLLVATAAEMIYRRGVSATGVDAITRESGVSKPTLYTHFRSKDELVTAALEWRHERRRREVSAFLAAVDGSGIDKVLSPSSTGSLRSILHRVCGAARRPGAAQYAGRPRMVVRHRRCAEHRQYGRLPDRSPHRGRRGEMVR
jgi:AcrR family transcriptional regulator